MKWVIESKVKGKTGGEPVTVAPLKDQATWVWEGWVPDNALTVLAGNRGAGKTRLLANLVRRIRAGAPWPDGRPMSLPADCRILWAVQAGCQAGEIEDVSVAAIKSPMDLEGQIRATAPRLIVVDCDCPRVSEASMLSAFARVLGIPILCSWIGNPHSGAPGYVVPSLCLASSVLHLNGHLEAVWGEKSVERPEPLDLGEMEL